MKSIVIDKVGHAQFREIDVPVFGATDVLVDVQQVGLCGSDLNTYLGLNPLVELPRVPGHEIGGLVVSVGTDVQTTLRVGDAVIVIPYTACGACTACRKGRPNACKYNQTLGVQRDGGLCDRIAIKADRLIANPGLPNRHLALIEPLSVGFHAVRRGRVSSDDVVLVLGGGMIGVGAIMGALARGARVIVSEPSADKASTLRRLGAEAVFDPTQVDLDAAVLALTEGTGADVIIEAAGLPQTFRQAVDLAPFAGRVVYVGYAGAPVLYETKLFNLKELDIFGSRNATREDFEAAIDYVRAHPEDADKLISKVYRWGEADDALAYWSKHRDQTFKIIIDVAGTTRD